MSNEVELSPGEVVGQILRMHRNLAKVDLVDMAEVCGMSRSGWSRVETGVSKLSVDHLFLAAGLLDVPPWTIVGEAEDLMKMIAKKGMTTK